ncbi:MAG TPA: mycofactocin biosynthesis glycosyltransferase MftF [Geobacteraceae bacterium]
MLYRLAQTVELVERDGESMLICRAPLCALRLNASLAALVGRLRAGAVEPAAAAEARVLEELATKGFVQRERGTVDDPPELPAVSVVIPVKDREEELSRCLDSLARLRYPAEKIQVIVVDDGSRDRSADVARAAGALVVSSGGCGRGPAAARNRGAAAASGELLAFIDSDCTASEGWLAELIPAFADPSTAAVGGLVDGLKDAGPLDRYEAVMSSLSLGGRERAGSSGDDTFYLPSCNLLVRRRAFLAAGGFADGMHVGEDVDLTWRLRDRGWTIRYLPEGRVWHEHRARLRPFMSRRFDYGTSEGLLQTLHPDRRKKMVVPPVLGLLLALALVALFTGRWELIPAGALLLAADAAILRRRLARHRLPLGYGALLAGRVRALGSLAYYVSYHLIRYYAVLLLALVVIVPLVGVVAAAAFACAAGVDYAIRKPQLPFIAFALFYLLEHISYGSGVFWGCVREKSFTTYRLTVLRQMEPAA